MGLRSLSPPLYRALRGYLGPRRILVDEIPLERRPSNRAVILHRPDQPPLERTLTLLSYNVKRAERWPQVGESLLRAVAEHQPDLIALQETPVELFRAPLLQPVFEKRSLFFAPFHQVERPGRRYPYCRYGQLIASLRDAQNHQVVELPTVNSATLGPGHIMKRIALYAELPTDDGRVVGLVNVHNEPFARRRDRRLQYEEFLRTVEDRAPHIAVCCGDFNPTFGQRAEPGLRLLEQRRFENALAHRWRCLDTCLARGHRGFQSVRSLRLPGSDHRPLVVELSL